MYHATLTPTIAVLGTALTLQHPENASLKRAAEKALGLLDAGLDLDFDGHELRVVSASRRAAGIQHVTDGQTCTCEAAQKHPYCWHRALHRLLLAEAALDQPLALRIALASQLGSLAPVAPPHSDDDRARAMDYELAA